MPKRAIAVPAFLGPSLLHASPEFVSSKKPHQSDDASPLHNSMAARIQQCFWYSHGRWNTKRRLAQTLVQAGLQYKTEQPLLSMDVFISHLHGKVIQTVFPRWLGRHFSVDDELCAQLLAAYVFATYRTESVPASEQLEHTAQLMECAHRLVSYIDVMIADDGARLTTRPLIRTVNVTMAQYLVAYDTWRSENEERVVRALMKEALLHVHDVMSQRNPVIENKAGVMLCLIAKYSTILCRPVEALTKTVLKSNEMRVMRSLSDSAFWGPCNLSVFRLVHELMMDEDFKLTPETTLTNLAEKYTPIPTSPLSITHLLVDLRSVIMWPVRDPQILLDLAQILDIENMSWPEDVRGIANRLVPLLCGAMVQHANSGALALFAQWHAIKPTATVQQMLGFMLDAARRLRYIHGALDLEQCRRHVRRHPAGFLPTHASLIISKAIHTKRTELWLQQTLQTYAQDDLERIAAGDPFALLGLHDQSIVDFALQGDLASPAPETLVFDIPRLRLIRADLELAPGRQDAKAFRDRVHHLVETNDGSEPPGPLADAVALLRNIVFVSRFQHGETVSLLARDVARCIMEANAILDGRRGG